MKKKLMLIGGGGHCHSVIDSVLSMHLYDEVGIVDPKGTSCLDVPVIGTDADIPGLIEEGWEEAFITAGSVGDTAIRRRLYEMILKYHLKIPAIIDPSAILAKGVCVGEGAFVGKRAVVNTGSSLGVCAIVNTGAIIEHDCTIGDFVHVSPGATVCGSVTVGNDSHIGAGSVLRQLVQIGSNSIIGAGSVVVKDIPAGTKVYGNPSKVTNYKQSSDF